MLEPWLALPGVKEQLETFSDAANLDLIAHGTTSDAETIRDTAVAQPLIVAASLISLRALFPTADDVQAHVAVAAGHSVGEFAASAVAGVLTDASAVGLVSHRARFMAEAAAATPTGMSAVVGGVAEEVFEAITAAGLHPANVNSSGQVVAAGDLDSLARLAANAPARARVMPLKVAGAFHTPFMQSAHDQFAPIAAQWPAADPIISLLSNKNGEAFTAGANNHGVGKDVLDTLTHQIVNPVRWDLCQETLTGLGITGLLELSPGGVLSGLAKRSMPGVEYLPIKSVDDLDAARAFISQHTK